MSDHLGWAWPQSISARRMHFWPLEAQRPLCGRLTFACADRHENPTDPCENCRRLLDRIEAGKRRAA